MKIKFLLCLPFLFALIASCGGTKNDKVQKNIDENTSSIKSDSITLIESQIIDGTIREVKIGNQIWMTKNLNVDKFRNGDVIPEAKTEDEWVKAWRNKKPAWCYYDNDQNNGNTYGKLYNWYAVKDKRGLAPAGYHVPSEDEWNELELALGGEREAGKKMKSTGGWKENRKAVNSSLFTALPGGACAANGRFFEIGEWGKWWSSTELNESNSSGRSDAVVRELYFDDIALWKGGNQEDRGLSVRCLKD